MSMAIVLAGTIKERSDAAVRSMHPGDRRDDFPNPFRFPADGETFRGAAVRIGLA